MPAVTPATTRDLRYLVVPGIGGSGPGHWQTHWEREWGAAALRIAPDSWDAPDEDDWRAAVGRGIGALGSGAAGEVVLVAHSLGCIAVAGWLGSRPQDERIAGAFLVAPPDREEPRVPAPAAAFAPPTERLHVPAVVVTSADDPFVSVGRAGRMAEAWGAALVDVGPAGHINEDSGAADWPHGRGLLTAFLAGLGR